jgi:DNA-binding NtrC family response regulator
MQVVVLSSQRGRAKAIGDCARGDGRTISHAASLEEFRRLRCARGESIVLLDAAHFPATVPEVVDAASRIGAPSLVITSDFDSSQWIRLFQMGVCDVLRDPVSAVELHRSMEAAIRSIPAEHPESDGRWISKALHWGRNLFGL